MRLFGLLMSLASTLLVGCLSTRSSDVAPPPQLERVSTAVPWPRGLVLAEGKVVALARGRHRSAGGPDPTLEDHAGTLFVVDPEISEPVVRGGPVGRAVRENGRPWIAPTEPPFRLWRRSADTLADEVTDRPYCTLAWDPRSRNFFICGYSGIDVPGRARFRKNASDSVLRYDLRAQRWFVVESHDPSVVDSHSLTYTVPNTFYPHHDPRAEDPPHGWLNGPDGAVVAGRFLYVVAKDNSVMVQYDLQGVQQDSGAGAPPSCLVLGDRVIIADGEHREAQRVEGHSALEVWGGYLYVGFRTTSDIVRFRLLASGDLAEPLVGERVAQFEPYDPATGKSADLMDMAFNSRGELFVSIARHGQIWNIGRPDPDRVFRPGSGTPYVDLQGLTDNPDAKSGNIEFDREDRLYICCGNDDVGPDARIAGVIYRATPR
ncbi:MAG: hypothetical protein AB7O52_07080 [Planctomycetota bacterium]